MSLSDDVDVGGVCRTVELSRRRVEGELLVALMELERTGRTRRMGSVISPRTGVGCTGGNTAKPARVGVW